MAEECIFCDIVAGKFGTKFLYEDDVCVAFSDMKPMAPRHVLVVPRVHHRQLQEAAEEETMLGRLLSVAGKVMKNGDFRVVVNNGPDAGQTVYHLHLHVLAGRHFGWPPG
jgi:diadenosine tetraphosphate (Ap4A) HIT family hydrolase